MPHVIREGRQELPLHNATRAAGGAGPGVTLRHQEDPWRGFSLIHDIHPHPPLGSRLQNDTQGLTLGVFHLYWVMEVTPMEDVFTTFEKIGGVCFAGKPSEVVEEIWKSLTLEQKVEVLERSIKSVAMVRATSGPGSLEIEFRG